MGMHNNPRIVQDGLVLHLDASDKNSYPGSGTTWYDVSGLNNHCIWSSTPTFNTTYFTFNGTSHYGTITNNSTLNFSLAQTLIIVMRHTYTSGRKNPWNQAYGGYGTWTHEDGVNISQYFGDSGTDAQPYIGISSATTSTSVWNVMAATRDTLTHTWYKNGTSTSTTSHSYGQLTTTSANILIGYGYAGYWVGDMSIVMAYTTTLSSAQILQNYNALKSRFGLT